MAKGKGKGQQFERDVCRQLSLWVSGGKSKNLFWRSSQSGGRATTLRKKGEDLSVHAGDVCAIDPAGEKFCWTFFIECKCLKTLQLHAFFYPKNKGILPAMWAKCRRQARMYHKVPLLICKENAKPTLLLSYRRLFGDYLLPLAELTYPELSAYSFVDVLGLCADDVIGVFSSCDVDSLGNPCES